MAAPRRILKNVASNSVGYLVNMVVTFLLAPFVLAHLGVEGYGIWTLVIALTGNFGLLDLGIRSAVGHYLTVYWARREHDRVNRTLNTAMVLMLGAAVLASLATVALAWALPSWKPDVLESEPHAATALLLVGGGLAFSFPMALYGTVIYARQRLDLQNLVGILQRLLTAGLTVVTLKAGLGIVGIASAVTFCNILGWAVNIVIAKRLMPMLRFSPRLFSRESLHELKGYGFWNFIVNAADNVLIYTDTLIIGFVVPALSAIAYYAVGGNLIPYYMSVIFAITWAMTPYAASCYATGDFQALRHLMIVGTRGVLVLATVIGGGLMLVGRDFLGQWMGWYFVSGEIYESSAVILAILTVATLLRASQSVGRQLLFAMQEVRFLGMLALGELLANLAISLVLIQSFGLRGVAFGTLIPLVITQGIVQPLYVMKRLELDPKDYFLSLLRTLAPILLVMDLMYWGLARNIVVDSWMDFLRKAALIGVPGVIVGVFVGLGRSERRWLRARLPGARKSSHEPLIVR